MRIKRSMFGLRHRAAFGGRRRWFTAPLVAATLGAVLIGANPSAGVASAILSGSNFESGDGNLVANTGNDWATGTNATSSAPNFAAGQDLQSGSGDNAFGQGAKEDINCPSVVNGSIPPNKSDLTRFYTSWELANGHYYLYLAWERSNVLGNANMDFEFNQSGAPCANGVTPNRMVNDRLFTFDFSGSGSPTIGMRTWNGSAWGTPVDLSAASEANGAVNTTTFTDPLVFSGSAGTPSLAPGTFGEAGIDLTLANVITQGGACTTYGSAELNSRSSSSFTSEIKDFIAPIPVTITNCGAIQVKKTFSSTVPTTPATFTVYTDNPTVGQFSSGDPVFAYSPTTTVGTGGIDANATSTSLPVADATKFKDPVSGTYLFPFYITVDTEYMKVTGAPDNTHLTVVRAKNGSTIAAHSAGVAVTHVAVCDAETFVTADSAYECTLTNLPFGNYVVQETVVPPGYTTPTPLEWNSLAKAAFESISSSAPTAVVSTANIAAPVDIQVNKFDDRGQGHPVQICGGTDGTPVTSNCAKFQLFNSTASTTLGSAITTAAAPLTVTVASAASFPSSGYVVIDHEISHFASKTATTLTLDQRGVDGTVATTHLSGAAVNAVTVTSTCDGTLVTLASGTCHFVSIDPGTYWIAEVQQPPGYGIDSSLARMITVNLGDTTANQTYTFTNPRLFKVLVFVCQESNNTLHPSTVTVDGVTRTSSDTATLPTGVDETGLCAMPTGGTAPAPPAVFPDKSATTYSGSVTIP